MSTRITARGCPNRNLRQIYERTRCCMPISGEMASGVKGNKAVIAAHLQRSNWRGPSSLSFPAILDLSRVCWSAKENSASVI